MKQICRLFKCTQFLPNPKLASALTTQQSIIKAGMHLQAAGLVLELFIDDSIPDQTPFNIESFPSDPDFWRKSVEGDSAP
jgi:hypothetical protein